MAKKKIAIACQGGGSQTAFSAGVLKSFFKNEVHTKNSIVSLSGTSGGGVCAALAWYSLLKNGKKGSMAVEKPLESFWQDNSTRNGIEAFLNDTLVQSIQLTNRGLIPEWKSSPSSPVNQAMVTMGKTMLPRFYDFKGLLEKYIKFDELEGLTHSDSPALLIGAANVLSGKFKKFNSLKNEITVEALLASAAVPSIFPAVQIGDDAYWDGLFSDNPPTDELIDPDIVDETRIPDELWVIQINPNTCKEIPTVPEHINDRRNEMIGNESLFQDLKHIVMVNEFLKEGAFKEDYIKKNNLKHTDVFIVKMSEELADTLDYASKINREADYINRLMEDGETRGNLFLQDPESMRYGN